MLNHGAVEWGLWLLWFLLIIIVSRRHKVGLLFLLLVRVWEYGLEKLNPILFTFIMLFLLVCFIQPMIILLGLYLIFLILINCFLLLLIILQLFPPYLVLFLLLHWIRVLKQLSNQLFPIYPLNLHYQLLALLFTLGNHTLIIHHILSHLLLCSPLSLLLSLLLLVFQ